MDAGRAADALYEAWATIIRLNPSAPVLSALAACLKQAGHPGFTGE
jgi:hypothetical protein